MDYTIQNYLYAKNSNKLKYINNYLHSAFYLFNFCRLISFTVYNNQYILPNKVFCQSRVQPNFLYFFMWLKFFFYFSCTFL